VHLPSTPVTPPPDSHHESRESGDARAPAQHTTNTNHTNHTNHTSKWEPTYNTHAPPQQQHPTVIVPPPSVTTHMYSTSDMLRPPVRQSPGTTSVGVGLMPINIKTRGETPDMQQVGILRSNSNDKVLALYGRPTYRGSSKWIYYTGTDKYHSIKLPVEKNKRDCTAEYGCDELYEDDEVQVKGYNEVFQTSIYQLDAPRYIPFVA